MFRSDSLAVRAYQGRGSRVCFVTFDPMSENLSLDRPAFAESFLAGLGIDSFHILSAHNGWYQEEELPEVLGAVRRLTAAYDKVIAYGSSMGGYAALRFGPHAGARSAIAISPQYSVMPGRPPYETRWRELRQTIHWLHERPDDKLPAFDNALIFCDDRDLDGWHAQLIAAEIGNATIVTLPYAGHPAGAFLSETGVISSCIVEATRGTVDVEALYRTVRQRRRRSGQYLYSLARRQPLWRMRTKLALMDLAVAAQPNEPVYLSYSALVLEASGQTEAALTRHAKAVTEPTFGLTHIRYGRCLWRAGHRAEARLAMERARLALPRSRGPIEVSALMLALDNQAVAALRQLSELPSHVPMGGDSKTRQRLIRAAEYNTAVSGWIGRQFGAYVARRTKLLQSSAAAELTEADRE